MNNSLKQIVSKGLISTCVIVLLLTGCTPGAQEPAGEPQQGEGQQGQGGQGGQDQGQQGQSGQAGGQQQSLATPFGENQVENDFNQQGRGMRGERQQQHEARAEGVRFGQRMEVATDIAEQLTDMNEIQSANVLVTRFTAFVAVVLEPGANQTQGAGQNGDMGAMQRQHVGNGQLDIPVELEDRMTNKVKSVDKRIQQVFISMNPDFVELTNEYMENVEGGRPITGLLEQFGLMVERIFPTTAEQHQ